MTMPRLMAFTASRICEHQNELQHIDFADRSEAGAGAGRCGAIKAARLGLVGRRSRDVRASAITCADSDDCSSLFPRELRAVRRWGHGVVVGTLPTPENPVNLN